MNLSVLKLILNELMKTEQYRNRVSNVIITLHVIVIIMTMQSSNVLQDILACFKCYHRTVAYKIESNTPSVTKRIYCNQQRCIKLFPKSPPTSKLTRTIVQTRSNSTKTRLELWYCSTVRHADNVLYEVGIGDCLHLCLGCGILLVPILQRWTILPQKLETTSQKFECEFCCNSFTLTYMQVSNCKF